MKATSTLMRSRSSRFSRSLNPALLVLLGALSLALTARARVGTPRHVIPLSEIGATATADFHCDALGMSVTADDARLSCAFQGLEAHATPEGLWLESAGPGGGKLRLTATTVGRASLSSPNNEVLREPTSRPVAKSFNRLRTTGTVSVEDKLVRFTRPVMTEEYSVSVHGVRQDFIIAAPPSGAGDLLVELALVGARAEPASYGARLRMEGSERTLAYSRLRAMDATGKELTTRLEVISADRLMVSVADASANYPVRIDPTFSDADWVRLGSGIHGSNPEVGALAVSETNLYVGGGFDAAGEVTARCIAKWDGNAWSTLGLWGLTDPYGTGSVSTVTVSPTGVYVGGKFDIVGGVPAKNIAKWNGSTWSALGSGIAFVVSALAVNGTDLYVGTISSPAGGRSVLKWDGNGWTALGMIGGLTYPEVRAIVPSGADLYVAGYFTTAGGVAANHIAKWNGGAWSPLGSGTGWGILTLAVSGTNLYAGGDFTTAGGVPANYIAKWDGSAWSALGSGMNGMVRALTVSGNDLYAAGDFTTAGGVAANRIAKWNGSSWSPLGSGVNYVVFALAADGFGHLFVGGMFTTAGTNACSCIARANLGILPTILMPPQAQTAEEGAPVRFAVSATGGSRLAYQWLFNETNLLGAATNSVLQVTDVQPANAGAYSVMVANPVGSVTSSPAMLSVIAPVPRRMVPALTLLGQTGNPLNLDFRTPLNSSANWETLDTVPLTNASQWYFDVTVQPAPHRFYRAWQTNVPSPPSIRDMHLVPAITLTGAIGSSVRIDYINQFGPINAWVTLDTITLSSSPQLYFDTSVIGQPPRLYRLVPVP